MEDGETSVQLSGVFHLICGRPDSRGGMAAVCANPISVWALQTAATHLMKSPFCASVRSALSRILKNSCGSQFGTIVTTVHAVGATAPDIRGAAVLVGIASCCWGVDSSSGALETR